MKALSLHPMYAVEIAVGDKPEEYRTWKTDYRGDLLICASTYNDGWEYPEVMLCALSISMTLNGQMKMIVTHGN